MFEIYLNNQLHTVTKTKEEADEVINFLKQNGVKNIFLFDKEQGVSKKQ